MPPKKPVGLFAQKFDMMKKVTAAAVQAKQSSAVQGKEYEDYSDSDDFTDSDSSSDISDSAKQSPNPNYSDSRDVPLNKHVEASQPNVAQQYDIQPRRADSSSSEEDLSDRNWKPKIPPKPQNINRKHSLDSLKDKTEITAPIVNVPIPPPPPQQCFPEQQHAVSGILLKSDKDDTRGCLMDEIKNFQGFRKQPFVPKYNKAAAEVVRKNAKSPNAQVHSALKRRIAEIRKNVTVSVNDDDDEEGDFGLS